jgi:hypothetical protein
MLHVAALAQLGSNRSCQRAQAIIKPARLREFGCAPAVAAAMQARYPYSFHAILTSRAAMKETQMVDRKHIPPDFPFEALNGILAYLDSEFRHYEENDPKRLDPVYRQAAEVRDWLSDLDITPGLAIEISEKS